MTFQATRILLTNIEGNEENGALIRLIEKGARLWHRLLTDMQGKLGTSIYPFQHVGGDETLARYLRGQGLERTRIREFQLKDGGSRWATLCYIDTKSDGQHSEAHAAACSGRLQRVQYPDFEPRFAAAVERLGDVFQLDDR